MKQLTLLALTVCLTATVLGQTPAAKAQDFWFKDEPVAWVEFPPGHHPPLAPYQSVRVEPYIPGNSVELVCNVSHNVYFRHRGKSAYVPIANVSTTPVGTAWWNDIVKEAKKGHYATLKGAIIDACGTDSPVIVEGVEFEVCRAVNYAGQRMPKWSGKNAGCILEYYTELKIQDRLPLNNPLWQSRFDRFPVRVKENPKPSEGAILYPPLEKSKKAPQPVNRELNRG